jgi:hypothetical protein
VQGAYDPYPNALFCIRFVCEVGRLVIEELNYTSPVKVSQLARNSNLMFSTLTKIIIATITIQQYKVVSFVFPTASLTDGSAARVLSVACVYNNDSTSIVNRVDSRWLQILVLFSA